MKQNVGTTFYGTGSLRVDDGDDPYHILGKRSSLELEPHPKKKELRQAIIYIIPLLQHCYFIIVQAGHCAPSKKVLNIFVLQLMDI